MSSSVEFHQIFQYTPNLFSIYSQAIIHECRCRLCSLLRSHDIQDVLAATFLFINQEQKGLLLFRWFFAWKGDFGNAHGDCSVLWKLGVSWWTIFETRQRIKINGEERFQFIFSFALTLLMFVHIYSSRTYTVDLLKISCIDGSWNLLPVGFGSIIARCRKNWWLLDLGETIVHQIFKTNLQGGPVSS